MYFVTPIGNEIYEELMDLGFNEHYFDIKDIISTIIAMSPFRDKKDSNIVHYPEDCNIEFRWKDFLRAYKNRKYIKMLSVEDRRKIQKDFFSALLTKRIKIENTTVYCNFFNLVGANWSLSINQDTQTFEDGKELFSDEEIIRIFFSRIVKREKLH